MPEQGLETAWTVLETEAFKEGEGLEVLTSGVSVQAGDVLLGVDSGGNRHLLIPLQAGEAFAEDRRGGAVHLVRVTAKSTTYLAAVCVRRDLHAVFAQFCQELLRDLESATSPARATIETLARWRLLFADARRAAELTEAQLVGLIAELLTLERIVSLDPRRRIECWTGPSGHQHDFRSGSEAIEVKGTLAREGRIVGISSVEQLRSPQAGHLHLRHLRLEASPSGDTLPAIVERIQALRVQQPLLEAKLAEAGVPVASLPAYKDRRYEVLEDRFYDVDGTHFPKIIPASFAGSVLPAGVLNLKYSIDLTNEPPTPLTQDGVTDLLARFANS